MVTCSGVKLEARAIMALGLNENRIRSFLISRFLREFEKFFKANYESRIDFF